MLWVLHFENVLYIISRQKTKTKVKEQHAQLKVKQENEQQNLAHVQQRPTQQTNNNEPVKLPSSPQPDASSAPQDVNLPEVETEEMPEQIKTVEANCVITAKVQDRNNLSPQPGCSNENVAPRPKQITASVKSNSNMLVKPLCTFGLSGEMQKSIKICPRKTISKTMPSGQKLIVVSNANSILQRTLTIPFVKNLSVKNFDKFKIVTTTTTTSCVSSVSSTNVNTIATNSVKHKVVTLRTNPSTKKVSLSHLQVRIVHDFNDQQFYQYSAEVITSE